MIKKLETYLTVLKEIDMEENIIKISKPKIRQIDQEFIINNRKNDKGQFISIPALLSKWSQYANHEKYNDNRIVTVAVAIIFNSWRIGDFKKYVFEIPFKTINGQPNYLGKNKSSELIISSSIKDLNYFTYEELNTYTQLSNITKFFNKIEVKDE